MTLDAFARVESQEGYLYELEKGVIVVVDVPGVPHFLVKQAIRDALVVYRLANPGRLFAIADGSDAALRLPEMQSERHPDLAAYLTPPPTSDEQPWEYWIPELVIEVVSPSSTERDYHIKRDEYLKAGVRLYWIVDPLTRTALVLTRRADRWQEQSLDVTGSLTTGLLPGFALPLASVFSSAG